MIFTWFEVEVNGRTNSTNREFSKHLKTARRVSTGLLAVHFSNIYLL